MRAAGVILAAGGSRRLGSPKQLAKVGGATMIERTLRCCEGASLSPIVIVLGARASEIRKVSDLSSAAVVVNDAWESGAASSIRAGITALDDIQTEAAILMTCDMPFVTSEHLQALLTKAQKVGTNVCSTGNGWRGVPACFLRQSFPALLTLAGDTGARKLLSNAPGIRLETDLDVDTPSDLTLANELAARAY